MTKNQNEINSVIDDFLEHHGIIGQRWGRQHGPPYPLDRNKDRQARLKAKVRAKQEREKEKTQKRIKKAQAKIEKKQEKAIKDAIKNANEVAKKKKKYSKSAESLYKHRDMYTTQEIAEALQKFEWENRIKDYMDRDLVRAKNRTQAMAQQTESLVKFAKSTIDGYNVAVGVADLFGVSMKPIKVPSSSGEQKKDDKK